MSILTHNPAKELSVKAKAFLTRAKKLYINGEFVDAGNGETFETEDPALGTAITEVASAKKEDVEKAARFRETLEHSCPSATWRPFV
jgi:hypothetical protein